MNCLPGRMIVPPSDVPEKLTAPQTNARFNHVNLYVSHLSLCNLCIHLSGHSSEHSILHHEKEDATSHFDRSLSRPILSEIQLGNPKIQKKWIKSPASSALLGPDAVFGEHPDANREIISRIDTISFVPRKPFKRSEHIVSIHLMLKYSLKLRSIGTATRETFKWHPHMISMLKMRKHLSVSHHKRFPEQVKTNSGMPSARRDKPDHRTRTSRVMLAVTWIVSNGYTWMPKLVEI